MQRKMCIWLVQEPQPGKNAFMHNGRLLVQYPRRSKSGPAGAGASMPPRAPLNNFDAPQARLAPSRNATPAVRAPAPSLPSCSTNWAVLEAQIFVKGISKNAYVSWATAGGGRYEH